MMAKGLKLTLSYDPVLIWTPHRGLAECLAIHHGSMANSCPALCGRVNLNVFNLHPHITSFSHSHSAVEEEAGRLWVGFTNSLNKRAVE